MWLDMSSLYPTECAVPQPGVMVLVGVEPDEVEVGEPDDPEPEPDPELEPDEPDEPSEFEPSPFGTNAAGKAMTRTTATRIEERIARRVMGLFHSLDMSEGFPAAAGAPAALRSSSDIISNAATLVRG